MYNGLSMIFLLVAFGGLLFFSSRTTKKRQQEQQNLLNSMKMGDSVITIGGLHGVIHEVNEKTVFIDCEGIILEFEKGAIRSVTPGTPVATDATVTTSEVEVTEEATDSSIENKE
jgi:preprotein translocase subunit YajC